MNKFPPRLVTPLTNKFPRLRSGPRNKFSKRWRAGVQLSSLSLLGSCGAVGPMSTIILNQTSNTYNCNGVWVTAGISNPSLDADGWSHDYSFWGCAWIDGVAGSEIDAYADGVASQGTTQVNFCGHDDGMNPTGTYLSGSLYVSFDGFWLYCEFDVTDLTGQYCPGGAYADYSRPR